MEKGLSVVVPVYNSSEILPHLINRLEPVLTHISSSYEIILVNDCSSDDSWKTICELAQSRSSVRGVNLMKNFGQHNALLCGIRIAQFNTTITMDKTSMVAAPAAQAADPRITMRGLQPGGMYTNEKYCGPITLIIGFCLFPCVCCCPCDSREVYVEPGTGRRQVLN